MSLQQEIEKKSNEIHTDSYPMSIGEIMSLYKDDELEIHPEFQRFFRWTPQQKSKLIESILLGIPIPTIFISQRADGVWDVIDGLQRLSTIFEFAGILKDKEGQLKNASTLLGTQYLRSLEDKKWMSDDIPNSLTQDQRLYIKRSKLNLQILKKESDEQTKYELFQRLNTGGTPLTNQELRNCILLTIDESFFEWLNNLVEDENFKNVISLSDKNLDERYEMELALRFFLNKNSTQEQLEDFKDIGDFITDKMIELTKIDNFNREKEAETFKKTFLILHETLNHKAFKKFNIDKDKFQGGFSISAFEVVSTGLAFNIDNYDIENGHNLDLIKNKVKNLWSEQWFKDSSGAGMQAYRRLRKFVPQSKVYFVNG